MSVPPRMSAGFDVACLPLPPDTRQKLIASGFINTRDFRGIGTVELASGSLPTVHYHLRAAPQAVRIQRHTMQELLCYPFFQSLMKVTLPKLSIVPMRRTKNECKRM